MSDLSQSLSASVSGMKAQATRLRLTSENIANTDTPGYRRKTAAFERVMNAGQTTGQVKMGDVKLSQTALERVYDPTHPLADDTGHYDGSNVDLMIEIADAREAQRSYEANLRMFDQTRQMSSSLRDLLRR
ncbi:flagellar basal body rod protein FlgC [Parasulfitobacter algicola]|uniref:Flagellar basal body rod protein FlgB n=1 Tax=Parasulfitobacter algicola TaxID=2614809 RepID=A0ABX2IP83_9RHOB|nr:flagellar basal body rod protein FlgC [Sulfitobacter algicola]NSX54678.1 flagellar basal body rod protein FlgC [Sulfitobacter algicola]